MAAIDSLASTFEQMKPGEHYCFDHCTVTIMDSPLCGRYKIVGQLAHQVRYASSADLALSAVDEFQDHPMPLAVEARRCELLDAARQCYELRDGVSAQCAADLTEIGDVFLGRARAISAEWAS